MSARAVAVGAVLAMCAARPMYAQQDTLHLTLDRALQLGHVHNPTYLQRENTAHASGVAARAGWAGFLPRLDASMRISGYSSTAVTGQDFYGQPVQLDTAVKFHGSSSSQDLSLNLTLFDGFKTLNNAHAAAAQHDADLAGVSAQGAQLEADIKTGFYQAIMNQRLIAVEERLLKSSRDQLAAIQRRFENAGATQSDVLGAQVAVARQEAAVESQQGAAEKSLLTLQQTIGLPDSAPIAVDGDLPTVFDPATLDTAQLVDDALTGSPVLAQSRAAAASAHASAAAARGSYWPTIQGFVGYGRNMNLNSYSALTQFNPKNHQFNFGINVTLPLFTGLQTSAQVASANAQSANADEMLRQQRLTVQTGVRTAWLDLENAYRQSQIADRVAALAQRRLSLSRERYQAGSTSINFTELQQIVDQAANAERSVVQARATFATALATLEQRVGGKVGP